MKTNILIILGRYVPGFKDGGPVRSILNLVNIFGDQANFKIMTADRDRDDIKPYDNIRVNEWNQVGKASVFYVKNGVFKYRQIKQCASECDTIYLCGIFNHYILRTLLLKRLRLIHSKVIIAPMGTFSPGAFNFNKQNKFLYLSFLKTLGLFSGVAWSVSSTMEQFDLYQNCHNPKQIFIAEDLPRQPLPHLSFEPKIVNQLNIIFISRISRKKNLSYAIELVAELKGNIQFSIYGTMEDVGYWNECQKLIDGLPSNIQCNYMGEANSEAVLNLFAGSQVFLFPTLGENFGHVIYESLASGCIAVISDQTPWQDLGQNDCGKVIPLSQRQRMIDTLQSYVKMDEPEFSILRSNAINYATAKYHHSLQNSGYKAILKID